MKKNSLPVVAKVFSNILIFCCKNVTHIFSAKTINVFAIFLEFNVTLANNFVKFCLFFFFFIIIIILQRNTVRHIPWSINFFSQTK